MIKVSEEKPNYKLRLSDFKPFLGLDNYIMRNPAGSLRASGREYILSAYNVTLAGALLATGWAAVQGLDALFN